MSLELGKVIGTILSVAAPKVIDKAQRQENVIKVLKQLKLNPDQPPGDVDGVYVYALVEYGVGKSEEILNFWREKEIKSKFWQAFNDDIADFLKYTEDFLDWNFLGDEIRAKNIDIPGEIREFYKVFSSVAKRSRKPGEVVIDPNFQKLPEQKVLPNEFKSLIEEKLKSFCGREFVFAKFEEFQRTHSKGYFTVVGDAGMGKSTIAAKYVSQHYCPCYFNILAERRNRPEDFLRSIRQQLIQKYALQGADTVNLHDLLVQASEKHKQNHENQPLVIIVDALDEVDQPIGAENILYLPEYLPERVYFFLTRRPYAEGQKRLRVQVREEELDLNASEYQSLNLADVKTSIRSFLNDPEYQKDLHKWITDRNIDQDKFITKVAAKSENNFMYLRYVLPAIARFSLTKLTRASMLQWQAPLPTIKVSGCV